MKKETKREYIPPKSQFIPIYTECLLQATSVSHAYPHSTEEEWGNEEVIADEEFDIDN